jgi:hypothetical protein
MMREKSKLLLLCWDLDVLNQAQHPSAQRRAKREKTRGVALALTCYKEIYQVLLAGDSAHIFFKSNIQEKAGTPSYSSGLQWPPSFIAHNGLMSVGMSLVLTSNVSCP